MICPKCKKPKEPKDFSWQTPNCGATQVLRQKECKECLSEINKQRTKDKKAFLEMYGV